MIVTHKNNRIVPAAIITMCFWASYYLIDQNVNNWDGILPGWSADQNQDQTIIWKAVTATTQAKFSKPTSPAEALLNNSEILPKAPGGALPADDVLLIMKTGSTSMWKRLLVHLTTTFSSERIPAANMVIYSDYPETIGDFHITDALANITKKTKASPSFDVYRQHPEYAGHNVYVEASAVDGDNYGPPGGWILDKFKFVPLIQHAGNNWPIVKWYIYMEDDAYLFLPSVLNYLSTFDWRRPHYLGSFAAKSDVCLRTEVLVLRCLGRRGKRPLGKPGHV